VKYRVRHPAGIAPTSIKIRYGFGGGKIKVEASTSFFFFGSKIRLELLCALGLFLAGRDQGKTVMMATRDHCAPDAKRVSFEIFPDPIGHWCARRLDGKVCGTFLERNQAVRFARRECRDESRPVLITVSDESFSAVA
jgi:hypothetical protein